jgi:hypothetical protein
MDSSIDEKQGCYICARWDLRRISSLADEFEKQARHVCVESFKRLVSGLCGFLISEIQAGYAEIILGLGKAGFALHRLFESLGGIRPPSELAQSHAEVVMRLRPIRLEFDRLQGGFDLLLKPFLLFQGRA